jgi:signal transduction histidine kinase
LRHDRPGNDRSSTGPAEGQDLRSEPARAETDDSLRRERHTSDKRDTADAGEDSADRIVDLARARADAVLTVAREKEDRDPPVSGDGDLAQERAEADEVLEDERASADEILRREREDSARVLTAFLPLARKRTDGKLLTERASSDAALSSRDDFLGMVSHDLKNLLAGIVLSASVLERRATERAGSDTTEGKRIGRGTERILLYAARMGRLIGDLVDVTSLTAGKLAVAPGPTDGRGLIAEALETFRLLAAEKRISLEARAMDKPQLVLGDHGRILQVLANLLGNAIKFTPEGGRISVGAERLGDEVRFSVSDSGPGIPETLLRTVFERFRQAGEDDRRGLGLGLYIARGIVEAHAGKIWVECPVGQGSTFHFTIPCPTFKQ